MTYEPGVLVRRQQREYPPELRKEIALAALEVGKDNEYKIDEQLSLHAQIGAGF